MHQQSGICVFDPFPHGKGSFGKGMGIIMKKHLLLLKAILLSLLLTGCGITMPPEVAEAIPEIVYEAEEFAEIDEEEAVPETAAKPETESDTEAETDTETAADLNDKTGSPSDEAALSEDGVYTAKEDVALYLHLYGHLPSNFITKKEAEKLGWKGGSLEPFAPGMCIGGNRFGNYEGLLPEKNGRFYTECDIDTLGADSRGAKRIVFSNDGLIYYTEDHYESFELLYGNE